MVTIPFTLAMPRWPEQGYDMVTAEGSSQRRRNVLLHGREEITAKECAVPRPGPGERERNQQAGKINSVSPRAPGPWSFWSRFLFSPSPSQMKRDVSHCSGCRRAAKSSRLFSSTLRALLASSPQDCGRETHQLWSPLLLAPAGLRGQDPQVLPCSHHPTTLPFT